MIFSTTSLKIVCWRKRNDSKPKTESTYCVALDILHVRLARTEDGTATSDGVESLFINLNQTSHTCKRHPLHGPPVVLTIPDKALFRQAAFRTQIHPFLQVPGFVRKYGPMTTRTRLSSSHRPWGLWGLVFTGFLTDFDIFVMTSLRRSFHRLVV